MFTRILAICIVLSVVGCQPSSIKEERALGISRYRAKQHIQSMAYLRNALRQRPSDAESNYYMGLNYRKLAQNEFERGNVPAAQKMLDKALYYYTQAIKTWPNSLKITAAKNEALEVRGEFERALAAAETTAHITRGTSEKHFIFLGNEYRDRGDYDNAIRNYKIALSMNPDSARAYAEMGRMYLLTDDQTLAIDSLERAYVLNPSQPGVVDLLADLSSDTLTPSTPAPASYDAPASPTATDAPTTPRPSVP